MYTLLYLALYYTALYLVQRRRLCCSFVTKELLSFYDDESARTVGVLDVAEYRERF